MTSRCSILLGNYRDVLSSVNAHLIFCSPPYNIGSNGARRGGKRKRGLFDPKSFGGIRDYPDSLPECEYQKQQIEFLIWASDNLRENGVIAYNHKPRRKNKAVIDPHEWILHPSVRSKLIQADEVIWDRGSTHNHDLTQLWAQTERIYILRKVGGEYRFRNTANLKHKSDIWKINRSANMGHCAPFPVELAEAVILAWSEAGDVVCDPYSGSGTTAMACLNTGRDFIGSEILEKYHRMANDRMSEYLGTQRAAA